MKIAIIGYSGSGKSTLANFLGQHYNCQVLHLDKIDDVSTFMLQSDWIIEGNYSACLYEERMREADCIVYFNFNRVNCLYRAFRRYLTYRGKTRPSMAEGCNEKFDFAFVKWILLDGRSKKYVEQYNVVVKNYSDKTIILKNQRQLNHYMKQVNSY